MRKRLGAILLCFVWILLLLPTTAMADNNHFSVSRIGRFIRTVNIGDTVTLSVNASGDNLEGVTYMWIGPNGSALTAEENSYTFEVASKADLGYYYCTAADVYGNVSDTFFRVASENHFSAAVEGDTDRKVSIGDTVTLSVSVDGDDLDGVTYTWIGPNGRTLTANENSYTLEAAKDNLGQYHCTAADAYGNEDYVFFRVAAENHFSATAEGGTDRKVIIGTSVTLPVNVTGDDLNGVTYTWDGPNGFICTTDESSYTLDVASKADLGQYFCTVADVYGNESYIFFRIAAENHFSATAEGGTDRTVIIGASVTLPVNATGDDLNGVTYTWDGPNGFICTTDESSYTLDVASKADLGQYFCTAADAYGNERIILFQVSTDNNFSAVPMVDTEYIVNYGDTVSLSVEVNADDKTGITYSWSHWGEIDGAISNSYTVNVLSKDDLGGYQCDISDGYGNEAHIFFILSMENHFSAAAEGERERKVSIGDTITLSVSVAGDDLNDVIYTWFKPNDATCRNIDNSSYTIEVESKDDLGQYQCTAADAYGNESYVFFQIAAENSFSVAPTVETEYTVNYGDTVTLSVEATADDTSDITYSWRHRGEIDGATSNSYTVTVSSKDDLEGYWCDIYDGYGNEEHIFFMISMENHFTVVPVGET
ncbi:MAG: hypothetical protein IJJ88_05325, partial [Oscillospiraceae bacterium]|nr:hypothetical protein [Oscillospiraceae bacterium]